MWYMGKRNQWPIWFVLVYCAVFKLRFSSFERGGYLTLHSIRLGLCEQQDVSDSWSRLQKLLWLCIWEKCCLPCSVLRHQNKKSASAFPSVFFLVKKTIHWEFWKLFVPFISWNLVTLKLEWKYCLIGNVAYPTNSLHRRVVKI